MVGYAVIRRSFRVAGLVLVGSLLGTSAAPKASAASPRLGIILPRGVQRGAEHEISFQGSNLADAKEVFFYSPGFEVTKLEPSPGAVKATVNIAADCRLGEHVAQIRCASGISDYRTFYVEALPAVAEKEPNSDFAAPQPIALGVTVDGVVTNEDVDHYVVDAKAGQRISAEVVAMRLGTALFDPYVAILDARRFELAAADDTPLVIQDCVASIVAPEDGKYIIQVRESAYGGDGNCRYRLHVGSFPRPTAVFPAGGKRGEEVEVRYLGDPAGELKQKIKLPAETTETFGLFAQDAGGIAPTPNPFRLFDHGNAFEAEPNDDFAKASKVELPLALNGVIEKEGDVDCFKFTAKKGQTFEIECYARRIRSALDPVMNLYMPDGKSIAGSDDSRGPDSYFRFAVPADGEYLLRVTDHLGRGGPDFVYRVEFQPIEASLSLSIPRVEQYGQYRQQIYVGRGNRFATLINAGRANFGGELVLDPGELPAGIQVHAQPMPANMSTMPVVFEAAADAPVAGKLVDFGAKLADPKQSIRGRFSNSADFIISGPGQSVYKRKSVARLPVAVIDALPFSLEIVQPKAPLVRDGSMQLKVVAHRKEGFNAAINVEFPFRPPGIGASSSVSIAAGQSEVLYPLSANGGAAVGKWPIYAIGAADVGGGTGWASSQLATLEVAAPFVTFAIQRASCEQGQPAQIYCRINPTTPFEGNAKAELLGLPPKVATTVLEFNNQTKEIIFQLKTEPTVQPGKYNNVFCQVTVTQQGEPVVSRAGATQLQIDTPPPPPPGEVAKPAPDPKPAEVAAKPAEAPKAKPLSRLEKLRLAAKQRAEAKAKAEASGGK